MPLTPEEEAELKQLEARASSTSAPKTPTGLSVNEQTELANLEDKLAVNTLKNVENLTDRVVSQTIKPFVNYRKHYKNEMWSGREAVRDAYEDPGWLKTPLGIALGTLQYVASPISAGAKVVGESIEEAAETAGVPKKGSEFIGKLGEEAVYFIPAGGTIRSVMMSRATAGEKAAYESAKAAKLLKTGVEKEARTKAAKETPITQSPKLQTKGALREQLRQEVTGQISEASKQALTGNYDESKRLFRNISEHLAIGDISPEWLPDVLRKHNLSPEEFARVFEETISTSGKQLQHLSKLKKELNSIFAGNNEALGILNRAFKEYTPTGVDKVLETSFKVENTRRAFLVGQVATAVRNFWSQAGRITLSAFDEALQAVIRGGVTPGQGVGETFRDAARGFNASVAALNRLTPKGRKRVFDLIDANKDNIELMKAFSAPVHEVALGGRMAQLVNGLNKMQEFYFRRIAFEAKLRQKLGQAGLDFNTVNPNKIPDEIIAESANYALEMTFASSGKSKELRKFLGAYNKIPGLTLIQPFPRFNLANAVPFIYEHSPLGYLSAMKPSTIKALASGNTKEFSKAMSRATIGSLMLDSAMSFRQSQYAGERWYEIKIGENPDGSSKNIDTRAFAPFSTYLFLAEAITNPQRLKPSDYAQAFIGLNRIAGTGLVATDMLRAKDGESLAKQAQNFGGMYIASFFTPARSLSDFYGAVDDQEMIYRDYKQSPLYSFLLSMPEVSQMYPKLASPVKTGDIKKGEEVGPIPAGVFRQLTGLSVRKKNKIEREIANTGLEWTSIAPQTGDAEANRVMSRYMAPFVKSRFNSVVDSNMYKKLTIEGKRVALAQLFKKARANARIKMGMTHPHLTIKTALKARNKDIEALIEQRTGKTIEEISNQFSR